MINTSKEFIEQIQGLNREFNFSMRVNDSIDISTEDLLNNFNIVYAGMNQNKLSIGQFCKSSCTFQVLTSVDVDWKNSYFTVSISINGASDIIPLGKFWVNEVNYNESRDSYIITAYDVPANISKFVDTTNRNVQDILTQFETEIGMNIVNKNVFTLSEIEYIPENTTWQDLIGYFAGYDGYNIRTDRLGNLVAYKFEGDTNALIKIGSSRIIGDFLIGQMEENPEQSNSIVPKDIIMQNGLNINDLIIINSFSVNNGKDDLSVGEGYGIVYNNPFITSLDNITDYLGKTYTPMELTFKGNPAIEVGDILYVLDKNDNYYTCYVMQYQLNYDGGLGGKIYCYSTESQEKVVPISPTDKKIEQVKQSISDVIDGLMNGSGYFSYIDKNGNVLTSEQIKRGMKPAGWQITDSEVITETTKGWRFILGGLYHSSNGFASYDTFALDSDGNINASAIKTGVLNAIQIIGSTMTFAPGEHEVVAKGVYWADSSGEINYGGVRFYGEGDFGISTNTIGMDAKGGNGIQFTSKGEKTIFYQYKNNSLVSYFGLHNDGNISIISNGNISIKSNGISNTLNSSPSSSTGEAYSLINNTSVRVRAMILNKGIYIITGHIRFASNSTGVRYLNLGLTDAVASNNIYSISQQACQGQQTIMQKTDVFDIKSDNTTVYLNAWQNSGSTLTVYAHMSVKKIV